ncbi:hypothetical protein LINPERHAP1_LOCUS19013, partial [Linum perenne]
ADFIHQKDWNSITKNLSTKLDQKLINNPQYFSLNFSTTSKGSNLISDLLDEGICFLPCTSEHSFASFNPNLAYHHSPKEHLCLPSNSIIFPFAD